MAGKSAVFEGNYKQQQYYLIDPDDVLVNWDLCGRETTHTDDEIRALADSILDQGQLQAAIVRKVEGKKAHLVAGHGRWRAVQLINKEGRAPNGEKLWLKVIYRDLDEREAFDISVHENLDRSDLTDLDLAYQHRVYRERFGLTDAEIAEKYRKSAAWVNRIRRLHQLAPEVKKELQAGKLKPTVAQSIVDLPTDEQIEVVNSARDEKTGKIDSGKVNDETRKKKTAKGQSSPVSMKMVKEFLTGLTGPGETDKVKNLAENLLKYLQGNISEALMERRFREFVNK